MAAIDLPALRSRLATRAAESMNAYIVQEHSGLNSDFFIFILLDNTCRFGGRGRGDYEAHFSYKCE